MENSVLKRIASVFTALAVTLFMVPLQVYADLAPIPEEVEKTFNFLPVILVVLVVIIALFLLKKFKK